MFGIIGIKKTGLHRACCFILSGSRVNRKPGLTNLLTLLRFEDIMWLRGPSEMEDSDYFSLVRGVGDHLSLPWRVTRKVWALFSQAF